MNQSDQLGDGDRKIPLAERSRRRIANGLYETLAGIRLAEGVDPKRYAPVEADIQYDIRRTMTGAEMAARETADLLLPAILTGHAPGRLRKTRAFLRHPLFAAFVILAVIFGYRELKPKSSATSYLAAAQPIVAEQIQKLTEANKTLNSELIAAKENFAKELVAARMRQTTSEIIGDAILNQGMVPKISNSTMTLTIPKALAKTSGQSWLVEVQHKISPDQVEDFKGAIQDTSNIPTE